MARLIEAGIETAEKNGREYICLLPGEESLYGYYEKFGFRPCCRADIANLSAGEKLSFDFAKTPRFESAACAELAYELKDVYGYTASKTQGYGIALYEADGEMLNISDIEINSRTAEHIELLMKNTGCVKAKVLLPVQDENSGFLHGMALSVRGKEPGENIFLNFTLD